MNLETIKTFGQIAAPAGLAIGAYIYVARDVVAKKIFPVLTKEHAYHVILSIVVMAWTIALGGMAAWTYVTAHASAAGASSNTSANNMKSPDTNAAATIAVGTNAKFVNQDGLKLLSDTDRAKLISSLAGLIHLEAGQSTIQWNLLMSCKHNEARPSSMLIEIAKINLIEVIRLRSMLGDDYPPDFVVGNHQTFRQLTIDLDERATILKQLAVGSHYDSSDAMSSCDLASKYQEMHDRLRGIEDDYASFVKDHSNLK